MCVTAGNISSFIMENGPRLKQKQVDMAYYYDQGHSKGNEHVFRLFDMNREYKLIKSLLS